VVPANNNGVYFRLSKLLQANKCDVRGQPQGHRQKASSIYKHYSKEHNTAVPNNFIARFNVIKKCTNKFDCLVNEMLCIQDLKPTLNVQSDSLRAKVFM
jgi:hypothetical protein